MENSPYPHDTHPVWPSSIENLPAAHAMQVLCSSYLPASHAMQELTSATPVTKVYVPFGQALQSSELPLNDSSRYVCSGHSWHTLTPTGAYLPRAQTVHSQAPPIENVPFSQSPHAVTPVLEKLPAEQSVHTRLASYFPASHAVQAYRDMAPLNGETVPALQATQSSTEPLNPISRYVWNGQEEHELLPAGAYVPKEQEKQAWAPSNENVPLPHGSHVDAPQLLAGLEYLPFVHQSHPAVLPTTDEEAPGEHRVQSSSVPSEQ